MLQFTRLYFTRLNKYITDYQIKKYSRDYQIKTYFTYYYITDHQIKEENYRLLD